MNKGHLNQRGDEEAHSPKRADPGNKNEARRPTLHRAAACSQPIKHRHSFPQFSPKALIKTDLPLVSRTCLRFAIVGLSRVAVPLLYLNKLSLAKLKTPLFHF